MAEPCFLCIDELAEQRHGENHFSVGLGDVGGFIVTLDGESVGDHALEAVAGEDGWVVLIGAIDGKPGKITECFAGTPGRPRHPYAVRRHGRVTVQAPPRPLPRAGGWMATNAHGTPDEVRASGWIAPSNLGGADG